MVPRAARVGVAGVLMLALSARAGALADDDAEAPRTAGVLSARWDYPTKASLGFGVIATRMPANFECRTPCRFHGVTLQGNAGLGGGELALGYGSLVG